MTGQPEVISGRKSRSRKCDSAECCSHSDRYLDGPRDFSVIRMSYKKECQEISLSVDSVPTLFLSRHSAQSFERALAIGEWSSSDDVVSCFVSSHETVRFVFLPVVPFHCRDGAHSFLETDKHNDCRIANHGPI